MLEIAIDKNTREVIGAIILDGPVKWGKMDRQIYEIRKLEYPQFEEIMRAKGWMSKATPFAILIENPYALVDRVRKCSSAYKVRQTSMGTTTTLTRTNDLEFNPTIEVYGKRITESTREKRYLA